ncbi:MAG: hypothetical protein PHS59_03150 [Paludibacter sp.]|nr:hypothetical protein [Paludibacter sp.]
MKITKLMMCTVCAVVLAFSLVGCDKLDSFSIDSPSDLLNRIDSIAASKPNTGDTTYVTIATPIVGAEDNSAGWWASFSDYYTIPSNKLLHLEFINYSSGANRYNNWDIVVTNASERSSSSYSEYFVLRSDAAGWGNSDYNSSLITNDYPDTDGDGDIWNDFITTMQGAHISIDIDHSSFGTVYVTATAIGTNGTTLVEKYQQSVSATDDINAFLVCDGSHYVMKKAYFIPSKVTTEPETPTVETVTYRADMTATITSVTNQVYNYTFFAEGLPEGGFGSFLLTDGGHMIINPTETYYCALADTTNAAAWFYPYSVTTTIGDVDNSTLWWSAFTNYTAVTGEGYFHYKFVNYSSKANAWNNWLIALTNGQSRSGKNYKEYFVLRSDNYGWGTYYSGDNLTNNFNFDNFITEMDGATVEISLKVSEETTTTKSAVISKAMKSRASKSRALKPGETIK